MSEPLVPTFLIGGAPRSGTTALAQALDDHPGIVMAKPYMPEPKVFMLPAGGPAEYRARYAGQFRSEDAELARGEKTSYYLESDPAREAIRAALPDVRVVFVVREPVDRAYSNWLWSTRNGLERLPFAEAVEREGRRPCPLPPEQAYARPFAYLDRGDYARFARKWFDALGRERVRFFLYEELVSSNGGAPMGEIQRFLGVPPRALHLPAGLENETRGSGPPLDPDVRERLRSHFAPLVREFTDLTGLDVTRWGYG